ncbi:YbhB/YbcL family Raf kinase inhibitor-like protein [Candidatus Nanosalina sp. VS9-1]|uniref:YbhB/YbcL family Raf kinase inhibitor-like protein n=1 Tax=Candidatus Nanosalina sp. VS9-1 TaxID=3388566 RepID=UPI0039E151A9
MKLTSTSFEEGEEIPERHGYMGKNVNPELLIEDVPDEAEALALVFKDPDAQKMAGKTWIHWTLWNIPADTEKIEEGQSPGLEGTTDFRKTGYNGPNPPDGPHNVAFHLYALEEELELEQEASYEDLNEAMDGKVIDEAVLEGIFP